MYRLFYLAICLAAFFNVVEPKPSFKIWNSNTEETATFGMEVFGDTPNLGNVSLEHFPDTVGSRYCVTGIWALHLQVEDYGTGPRWPSPDIRYDICRVFVAEAWVGSARLIGEAGVNRLSLYYGDFFRQNGSFYTTDQSTLDVHFESVQLVGQISVEFFTQPNHQGPSFCLEVSDMFVSINQMSRLGYKPGDIKSFRFHCFVNAKRIEIPQYEIQQPVSDM